jgi:hypothetical protein
VGGGSYQVRSRVALPPQGIELSVEQTASYREDGLRLEVRVWTSREARVAFAGLELPSPATVLRPSVDVRTASGFYQAGRDEPSFAFDDAEGLTLHLERGKVFVASDRPLYMAGRTEGSRGALRIGQRGGALRTSPLTIALTVRGTTADEEREVVSKLVAAERAARQGRYGEALERYQEIARLYPHRRSTSETARQQLALLRREALDRLARAKRLLARAEMTSEADDFDAARAALEPLVEGLEGTPHATEVAAALTRCAKARQSAANQQAERQAQRLLARARKQRRQDRRHIARLYCSELLARYPECAAAAEARALIEALDKPPAPEEPDSKQP